MTNKISLNLPYNERKFNCNQRAFLLVDSDYYKNRKLINCISISCSSDLRKFFDYCKRENVFLNFLTEEDIKSMEKPFRHLYSHLKALRENEEINGIHLGFRPSTKDVIMLKQLFEKISHVFIAESTSRNISLASIDLFYDVWKVELEICNIHGLRLDLGACFQIEVYQDSGEKR
jgi:hypothetical protein